MADATYNPSASHTAGLEWRPDGRSPARLDSPDQALAMFVPSTTAELIDQILFPSWVHTRGRFWVYIYEAGDEVGPEEPDQVTYRPNETTYNNGNRWAREPGSSTSNVHLALDDEVPTSTDYARTSRNTNEVEFNIDTATYPADSLVAGGEVVVRGGVQKDTGILNVYLSPTGYQGRFSYDLAHPLGSITLTAIKDDGIQEHRLPFPAINPWTDMPWTTQQIRDFDTSGNGIGMYMAYGSANKPQIHQLALDLRYIRDLRQATARLDVEEAGGGGSGAAQVSYWRQLLIVDSAGTWVTWSKQSGVDYVYVLRRMSLGPLGDQGDLETWRLGRQVGAGRPDGMEVSELAVSLGPNGYPVESTPVDSVLPIGFHINGGSTFSEDSQPYVSFPEVLGARLDGVNNAVSYITTETSANYRVVTALVGIDGDPADVREPINVEVTQAGLLSAGDGTITVDEWLDADLHSTYAPSARLGEMSPQHGDSIPLKLMEVVLDADVALNPANDNRVQLSVATPIDETAEAHWVVPYLSAAVTDTSYTPPTTAAYANRAQPPTTISTRPATLIDLTVTVTDHQLDGLGDCTVDAIQFALLTWTASALADDFLRYEVQRSDDAGTSWATVATITDESAAEFHDYEAPIGVAAVWRVRVVRVDDIGSAWSLTVSATLAVEDCEWVFTSNEAPELSVAYDRDPDIEFAFDDPGMLVPLAGRNYVAAFRETEHRGDAFQLALTIHFGGATADQPAAGRGRPAFDALVALGEAALSYVCVKDPYGTTWLADVWCDKGRWAEPGARYSAVVAVNEVTDVPSTPDVAAP